MEFVLFAIGLVPLGGSVVLYFLPAIIPQKRGHENRLAITILDVLLGWIFLDWIAALVWAFTTPRSSIAVAAEPYGAMRTCQHCFSEIPAQASICRFCQRDCVIGSSIVQ